MKSGAHAPCHSSKDHNWRTPLPFFQYCERIHDRKFDIDVAASAKDALCKRYIDKKMDALNSDWRVTRRKDHVTFAWCNPPYDLTKEFIEQALILCRMGVETSLLLASRTGSEWWPLVHENASVITFIRGRVKFISQSKDLVLRARSKNQAAGFDSALVLLDEGGLRRRRPFYECRSPTKEERGF